MDSAHQTLKEVQAEIDALEAALKEYEAASRAQVRALMSKRHHLVLEDRVLKAQIRLDSAIPEDADARDWGSVRRERKRLLVALDKIGKAVHQKTSGITSAHHRGPRSESVRLSPRRRQSSSHSCGGRPEMSGKIIMEFCARLIELRISSCNWNRDPELMAFFSDVRRSGRKALEKYEEDAHIQRKLCAALDEFDIWGAATRVPALGEIVSIFSFTAGDWVLAMVVDLVEDGRIRVEYEAADLRSGSGPGTVYNRCGKTLGLGSQHLRVLAPAAEMEEVDPEFWSYWCGGPDHGKDCVPHSETEWDNHETVFQNAYPF